MAQGHRFPARRLERHSLIHPFLCHRITFKRISDYRQYLPKSPDWDLSSSVNNRRGAADLVTQAQPI